MSSRMQFAKFSEKSEVVDFLKCLLTYRSEDAIAKNGVFRMGVSGGSIVTYLSETLPRLHAISLEYFRIYFCDERFVPATDKDSTYGAYKAALIPSTCIKEQQLIGINTDLTLKEAAQDYEEKILKEFRMKSGEIPEFDVLFLGIGPDGHTCSLFPEHALLREKDRLIAAINDSPKPPPQRVTMTLPLINNAKCVIFIALGEDKTETIKRIFVDKESLPAGLVKPLKDSYCILDTASGRYINF